jgi:DNA-binding NtrC family response regulator
MPPPKNSTGARSQKSDTNHPRNRPLTGEDGMHQEHNVPKLADLERATILETLMVCNGNRTRAAGLLGISIRCLRNKLHNYAADGYAIPGAKAPGPETSH